MAKKLWSVFTDDMDHCYFTGSPYVERHHIFEGRQGYGPKSENRGIVVPSRLHIFDYSTIPYSFGNKFITISVISYNIFLHTDT